MSLPPARRFPWMESPDDDEDDELEPPDWCSTCDRERPAEGCPACYEGEDYRRLEVWG